MILNFHGVGEPPADVGASERTVWVSRELLGTALDAAARRDDIEITFDDGNRSDVEIALPELAARGLRARFFLLAARFDTPGYLTPGDARALAEAGMAVGLHGLDHRPWRGRPERELEDELARARAAIEDAIGAPVTEAACPFGAYDRRALRVLRRGGYERVYTSDGGAARPGAWLQPRNTVTADPAALERLLNGGMPVTGRVLRAAKRTVKRWR